MSILVILLWGCITYKKGIECPSNKEYLKINNNMSLPQRTLPQRTHNDLWLKLPEGANRCITELMYNLPNPLVVRSTYSTHFSDSVCGRLSVRPTLRHCIRIWLNKPITVLRLIGFSKKKWAKRLQLIKKCSVLNNSSYRITVIPGGQSSISKCQKSKITNIGHNFVIYSWILIWI